MSIRSRMNRTATFLEQITINGGWNEERTQYREACKAPCRLVSLTGRKYLDGRLRDDATHKLFCIVKQPVNTSWIVDIAGRRFSITPPINDAGGGIEHHLEILLKEM